MKKLLILSGLMLCLTSGFHLAQGQSAIIKGQVIDSLTQETLPTVNIVEIDKNGRYIGGTVTDLNGNYVLQVSDVNNPIQVSFIGFQKRTTYVNGRTVINFSLQPVALEMEEVRIVGEKMGNDGLISIRDRATSVSRLEMEELKSVMSTSVEDMMQGRL
jgi:hypothetical protein